MSVIPRPDRPAVVPNIPEPVPSRSDRLNFAARGDATLGAIPNTVRGMNTNNDWVSDMGYYIEAEADRAENAFAAAEEQADRAQEQAEAAMFINHFKGLWEQLDDAAPGVPVVLPKPATVKHGGLFWALLNNLADAMASEPGMTADWTVLPGVTEVATPNTLAPAAGAVDVGASTAIVLQANTFATIYVGDTHVASQWQLHPINTFATPLYDTGSIAPSTTHTLPAGTLLVNSQYYWRVRYRSSRGTWSAWSRSSSFITAAVFNQFISVPAATPAAYGDAFEGGFFFGMIWNELAQSASSKTLATGMQSFVLPASMYTAPLVYSGQQLEVRSRANPDNRFAGTVVSANGVNLVINVTSINGAGTFADWSIMSRYRLIMAPKSSGETSSLAVKNAATALPAGAFTLTEGAKATASMVAGGDAATYPAAWWAKGLTIGGYSDWYVPARDEAEQMYRNLKPSNSSSSGGARGNAPASSYQNLGSWSDASTANGVNRHSVPLGVVYSGSGYPAQTGIVAFQAGGAEALPSTGATVTYWTSSDYNSSSVWALDSSDSASLGLMKIVTKTSASVSNRLRAVRRSII